MNNVNKHIIALKKAISDELNGTEQSTAQSYLNAVSDFLDSQNNRNRTQEIVEISNAIKNKNYDINYQASTHNDEIDHIGLTLCEVAQELNENFNKLNKFDERIEHITEVLMQYAGLNFSQEAQITPNEDEIDAIAYGLNLLGQEIKFYKEELEEKTHTLQEAQRVGKMGSWEFNLRTLEVSGSEQFYHIYDMPVGTPLNKNSFDEIILKEDNDILDSLAGKCVQDKKPYSHSYPISTPKGKAKHIKAYGELLTDSEGNPYKLIGTIIDITELENAKIELDNLNKDLELKVKERTTDLESFTYSVSHDLRSPLRAINGFAEILEEDYKTLIDDEGIRLIGIIKNNATRMSQLIDDLLQFSRLNRQEISLASIDLNTMLDEVKTEVLNSWHKISPKVTIEKLPIVFGDQVLLKQVWQNIMDNAVKYSSKVDNPEINITYKSNTTHHFITISDNGVGFNEEYKQKLFEVFQRLHGQNEFSGTGIGLSIVKRIIDKHKGSIKASSELGKGATFTIGLLKTV